MNTTPSVLVVAGIVRQADHILITQRLAEDDWGGYWEFPGGKVEAGETEQQALERELWEEVGLKTVTGKLVWEMTPDHPTKKQIVRFFYSSILSGTPECREIETFQWVTRKEMVNFKFLPSNEVLLRKLIDEEV